MTSEQKYFLVVLSDYIHERNTAAPSNDLNIEELKTLFSAHSIGGIAYYQCRAHRECSIAFHALFLQDVFVSVNRHHMLKQLVDQFQANGIKLICMKGSVYRDCYSIPELRSMGDIDIIIRSEDRIRSDQIMCDQLGYRKFVDNHAVWNYLVEPFEVEIHDHMFYENLANRIDYRAYFDHVWDHCHNAPVFGIEAENLLVPDAEFHFLYLMAHTAKHIINSGSGFRAYLDMVLMVKNCDLDWEWLEQELKRLELLDFTITCFALCERWFDMEMPLGRKELADAFFDEITEKTFLDGVFGLKNEQNNGAHTAKEIKRDGSYLGGSIKLTIKKMFPSYRDMQLIPWYKWVNGKPWLMPAAWIYRWFYCIKNKRKDSIDLLTEPMTKKDIVEKRQSLIQSWGL